MTLLNKEKNIEIEFSISSSKMEAYIIFKSNDSSINDIMLTVEEIKEQMYESGIVYGINEILLYELTKNRLYNNKYLIAKGEAPTVGKPSSLSFKFDNSSRNLKPKVLKDGTVDYRNLDWVKMANVGDVLVELNPPTEGDEGINVLGERIPGLIGKDSVHLPKGKNTKISEDGLKLISEVAGQIIYMDNKVNVVEVLEIQGDVGVGTGNINFNGSVIVRGNVLTEFSIKALGNVEIYGMLEGAEIYSGGNILVGKGITGMSKSNIRAEGNVTAKIIQDANIIAGGNVYADGIMHSEIKCDGFIEVKGKKGLLVGGKAIVRNGINAKIIGSPMGTLTEIYVGLDASKLEEYTKKVKELKSMKVKYNNYVQSLNSMLKAKAQGMSCNKNKKASFLNTINTVKDLKNSIEILQEDVLELKPLIESNLYRGDIIIEKVIYQGVNIKMGNIIKNIEDEAYSCKIKNIDGNIKIIPLN